MKTPDEVALDALVARFYALFTNVNGAQPHVAGVYELFIPQGVIIKAVDDRPEAYTLAQFVEPREKLLSDGTLVDFRERETSSETLIFGNIAQRVSRYEKSGTLSGMPFHATGVKTMQLVKARGEWKFSSLSWFDY